jgi:hypothetical protein
VSSISGVSITMESSSCTGVDAFRVEGRPLFLGGMLKDGNRQYDLLLMHNYHSLCKHENECSHWMGGVCDIEFCKVQPRGSCKAQP